MDAVNTLTAATTASAASAPASGTDTVIDSDFETFLKMLTAQLENQDPLNPLESQDFATQLATFSGVEQQTQTNALLEDMLGAINASGLGEMSQWIGKEAQIADTLPFAGAPMTLSFDVPPGARTSALVVRNSQGEEVARHPVDSRDTAGYLWTGQTEAGQMLPAGSYSFHIANTAQEGALPDGRVTTYVRVTEARTGPQGQTLLLEGGLEVAPDAVTALRLPTG